MSGHKVGDIVSPPQTRDLPVGTILLDESPDGDFAVAVKIASGKYRWILRDEFDTGDGRAMQDSMDIYVGNNWKIIRLPDAAAPAA